METQPQLLSGEGLALVSQQLPPNGQDSRIVAVTTDHSYGDHDSRGLSSTNPTPSRTESPASVIAPVNKVAEERANGSQGIEFSSPPPPGPAASALTDDGVPYDPESGTCTKKRRRGGWSTTPFIFGAEGAERLAVTASQANLISYLVNVMHQKTLQAATMINTFGSTAAWTPVVGAFIADSFLGPYATIIYGSFFFLAGLIVITTTAVVPSLQPAPCDQGSSNCEPATALQIGLVYLALSLMVVASGGIRPCVGPFGASQFDQNDPKESRQLKSYFNWYFFSVTVASFVAVTAIVYIQDNVSWSWGYGIAAAVMAFSIVSFTGGSFLYRFTSSKGSPFTRMAQVLVAAARKRRLALPSDSSLLYYGSFPDDEATKDSLRNSPQNSKELKVLSDSNSEACNEPAIPSRRSSRKGAMVSKEDSSVATGGGGEVNEEETLTTERERPSFLENSRQFRFLDKAALELETDWVRKYNNCGEITSKEVNPWRLCPVRQVEELKSILRLLPMWTSAVVSGLASAQASTYQVQQARTMNRDIGAFNIPPASITVISKITILIWVPFFDRILVPKVIAPRTGHPRGFTYLQKIGIGYVLNILTSAITIFVEYERRRTARNHGFLEKPKEVIPFSVFFLAPQEIVSGIASSFATVGNYEFYYHMVPEYITSTAAALSQTAGALGTVLASPLLNGVQSVTESPGHPGWLDENLNKAHLDYFYTIVLFLEMVNLLVYIFVIAKWYRKQLVRN